ncbi:hypothetical protein [Intestinimonas butyriciproducens]|uniref:hypothetical protein n=1 Tax=Intestinimonas butyriciproducens TaxID=1297617 RepID=UPI002431D91E|nr:hypothetical protein [Intestinimonas butyriciproducens]MCI6362792.1 hypothetical protein [Intestinimonas butyriciproducens]MDY3616797.1 hypothetical protein [Intestinimonas butyriciproducens]
MILKTNGQEADLLSFVPGAQTVRLETAEPVELGETLEVWTELEDGPFLLASYAVADWLRVGQTGGSICLTQLPVPELTPEPEPEPDALTQTQLAVAELAQVVEDNNTAAQLAIAELAEALLGGETNG